jgi:flagellin
LTNVASLQAQNYLQNNVQFQNQTIGEVTSGLRIVKSGDDAAGLAIANTYKSQETVLTQGIQNANDGLSQLQIADGGLSNISQLLNRASTLATQSASGTFAGGASGRGVLNQEFQSVIGEIDRQAQAIGLNQGGTFAKALSVFVGGGQGTTNAAAITDGTVTVDLSKATVDSKSLGLSGFQALGNPSGSTVDLGASSTTSVANILTNVNNTKTESVQGYTNFIFTGPGFATQTNSSGQSVSTPVSVSVNLAGVTDTNTLVNAINTAIQNTGTNGNTAQTTAFKNANITATIVTGANGQQQLAFNSSSTAFQVAAGDQVANAFLGNFSNASTATGNVAQATATAGSAFADPGASETVSFNVNGFGLGNTALNAAVTVGTTDSGSTVAANINTQIQATTALANTGLTANWDSVHSKLYFTANAGSSFTVSTSGDTANSLGFGSFQAPATSFTATGLGTATDTEGLALSIGGQSIDLGTFTGDGTVATAITGINTAIGGLTGTAKQLVQAAGISASKDPATGFLTLSSSNGTSFGLNLYSGGANAGDGLGFGAGALSAATTASIASVASAPATNSTVDSGGAQQSIESGDVGVSTTADTGAYSFNGLSVTGETQTVNLAAVDANGTQHALTVNLNTTNAGSIDQAIATINQQLQSSNDGTLQQLFAVKEGGQDTAGGGTVEGIKFMSKNAFNVSFSATSGGQGLADTSTNPKQGVQGGLLSSGTMTGGSLADISNQNSAQAAVTALTSAVSALGAAQAVVGRGENQFTYAANLAQSQLTNTATAESAIRDANLAQEAANLTKAQVLIQAGVAALAQANAAPQQLLSLLKG